MVCTEEGAALGSSSFLSLPEGSGGKSLFLRKALESSQAGTSVLRIGNLNLK